MSECIETESNQAVGKKSLGILSIVLLVVATTGPISILLSSIPLSIGFGNGIGVPAVYVMLGLVYLLFSFGFSAMSTRIRNGDSFFRYVAHGLGQNSGMSAAFIALVSYLSLLLALYALFGQFFSDLILSKTGFHLPWWLSCALLMIVINLMSIKNIEFNGKVLGWMMVVEFIIIGLFYIFAFQDISSNSKPLAHSFAADTVFTAGIGASIVILINSFFGFETVAIYAKDTKNPNKTIPVGLIISVITITALYAFSAWMLINVLGAEQVVTIAQNNPAGIWFDLYASLMHPLAADVLSLLLLTSLSAAILSYHNIASRYLYLLSDNQLLPKAFSRLHPKEQTPVFSSRSVTLLMLFLVVLLGFALQFDAMTQVVVIAAAPTALGIVIVQIVTNLAVMRFFQKNKTDVGIFSRIIAPSLCVILFLILLVTMLMNLDALTGVDSWVNYLIPASIAITAIGSMIYSKVLSKSNKGYLVPGEKHV